MMETSRNCKQRACRIQTDAAKMLIQEVVACSFSNWYCKFSAITYESQIIPVDQSFVDYLLQDNIHLPKCCALGDNDDSDEEVFGPDFPQIEASVRSALSRFKHIFVKLNWSSCEDAQWTQATGTKLSNLLDFFVILKASDKIVHDLTMPFEHCSDFDVNNPPKVNYELVLRKWINMNPSMEFRCFIAANNILAICQRDVRSFYDHIGTSKQDIIDDIFDLFQRKIRNRFDLDTFVIDVYRPSQGQVILIDMNPFGEITDSLLFDWDELRSMANAPRPIRFENFRYIESRNGIQNTRFELNSLPLDAFNANMPDG